MGASADARLLERSHPPQAEERGFPRFLVKTGYGTRAKRRFLSFDEAVEAYARGDDPYIEEYVLEPDMTVRQITRDELMSITAK